VTVLTIFNGTKSFPNTNDWDVTKYLRLKRKQNRSNGGGSKEIADMAGEEENIQPVIGKKKRRVSSE